eukprot:TRINITY_DN2583_c0_g1_i2.p3 TRINITY_DN2583_c0_g1~~TRINITY_DN2583_c0_g1_i2.p3  ORF type:complete len:103 (-),score=21.12 TRINITY_DN2583_c0_g1_i2:50-358(-)
MPKFNPKTGLLEMSRAEFKPSELGTLGRLSYTLLRALGMVNVVAVPHKGKATDTTPVVSINNLTIINAVLRVTGPSEGGPPHTACAATDPRGMQRLRLCHSL